MESDAYSAHSPRDFDVSIVVALPRETGTAEACLLALAEHSNGPSFEVAVVVDEVSASLPILGQLKGDVRVVRHEAPELVSRWLRGADSARGRFLAFLDGHVLVTAGWLEELVSWAERHGVAAIGPRVVTIDGSERPVGACFASDRGQCRAFEELASDEATTLTRRTLPALGEGCIVVRAEDYATVTGFSPGFAGFGAVLDLALRLHARGRAVAYQPRSVLVSLRTEPDVASLADADLLRRRWGVARATSPDALWVDGRSRGRAPVANIGEAGHFRDDPQRLPPPHVLVGRHTFFGSGARFLTYTAEERIRIGKYCSFAADVTIFTGGGHSTDTVSTFPFEHALFGTTNPTRSSRSTRDTVIGNDVWVGDGAVIAGGVCVGDGAVIGTRAVVFSDVPPYAIVAGNPATVLRHRFSRATIAALLRIAWWEWPEEEIERELEWFFRPIGDFVRRFDAARDGGNNERATGTSRE